MDFPKSVPSVGLVDGKFVDEDVVAGTPGSLIPAQWGNAVTEEVLNVITSGGLTPDEDNNAQLLAAINAKIAAAIPGSPPDASTTVKGIVELATNLETQAGSDTERAVTPAGLASRTATETRAGILRVATQTEVNNGVDDASSVTPLKLANKTQATAYDVTAGKLAATGSFGAGSTYANPPLLATDINGSQLTGSGIYRYNSSTTGKPPFGSGFGSLDHRSVTMDGGGNYATQLAIDYAANNIGFRRLSGSGGWQSWVELYHKGNLVQATEATPGIASVATQALTNAGVDDSASVTPKKLRFGFQFLAAANGYLVFPTWMGGFIIQWGTATIPNSTTSVNYPMTYPTAQLATVGTARNTGSGLDGVEINAPTTASFPAVMVSASGSAVQIAGTFSWISVGY